MSYVNEAIYRYNQTLLWCGLPMQRGFGRRPAVPLTATAAAWSLSEHLHL
jgi:hypothetical protein